MPKSYFYKHFLVCQKNYVDRLFHDKKYKYIIKNMYFKINGLISEIIIIYCI